MSNKHKLIYEFDIQLIANFFKGLNRQGPGGDEETQKALSFLRKLPSRPKIADIGCGTGQQTQTLATNLECDITAVDILPELIDGLQERCLQMGPAGKSIKGLVASMDNLPFSDEEFDIFWAEGSIYNIGFEKGLKEWRRFLKPNGYIAVTEWSWVDNRRPDDLSYFSAHVPEIDNISNKLKIIENTGYMPLAHFVLPEHCWVVNFYEPMQQYMQKFLDTHHQSIPAIEFVEEMKNAIAYYNKYQHFHNYVFYIAQKIE